MATKTKKSRIKEAEQIVEENVTPEAAVPATPSEVETAQAAAPVEPTVDPAAQEEEIVEPAVEEGVPEEVVEDPEVKVNPETISLEMNIPTDQLAAAVAQVTGDVEVAETAPDLGEDVEGEEPLVSEETSEEGDIPVTDEDASLEEESGVVEEPQAVMSESKDIHSNPGYKVAKETQEGLEDIIDNGVKNMDKDTKKFLNTDSKIKESEEVCPECGKNPCECEGTEVLEEKDEMLGKSMKEVLDARLGLKESKEDDDEDDEDEDDEKDLIKDSGVKNEDPEEGEGEKLSLEDIEVDEDGNDPDLPGAFEADGDLGGEGPDVSIFDDIDEEESEFDGLYGKLNDILGDAGGAAEVADALRTSADVIDAVAEEGGDSDEEEEEKVEEVEDLPAREEDSYLLSSLLDDDEEPLDFDRITDEGYEDYDDEEESIYDDLDDDEEEEEDFDEDEDLEESVVRVPCKFPKKESKITERTSSRHEVKKLEESLDGIIYPAGSDPDTFEEEPLVSPRENLVRAHETMLESRRRAIRKFRESVKKDSRNRENEKFKEALRSSVKVRSLREGSGNSKSWSDNQFLDKYEESQKLDFSRLFEDGFLG